MSDKSKEERVIRWLMYYFAATGLVDARVNITCQAILLLAIWCGWQFAWLKLASRTRSMQSALGGIFFQILALSAGYGLKFADDLNVLHYTAAMGVPLILAAWLMYCSGKNQNLPLPRYDFEAWLVSVFLCFYIGVLTFDTDGDGTLLRLAACSTLLLIALFRNIRFVTRHSYGPVQAGKYMETAYESKLRGEKGVRPVLAALLCPEVVIGLLFVTGEAGMLLLDLV